jgi:hypothetical protein
MSDAAPETSYSKKHETVDSAHSDDDTLGNNDESASLARRRLNSTRIYYNRIHNKSQSGIRPSRISATETDVSSLRDPSISISRTGSRINMSNTSESIEVSSTPQNGDDSSSSAFVDCSSSDASSPQAQLRHLSRVDIIKSPAQGPTRLKSVKEDDVLSTVTGDSRTEFRADDSSMDQKQRLRESMASEGDNFEPMIDNGSSRSSAGSSGETSSISSSGGKLTTILNSVGHASLFRAFVSCTFPSNSNSNSSTNASGRTISIRTEDSLNTVDSISSALHTVESIEVSANNDDVITISHSGGVGEGKPRPATTTARREPNVIMAPTRSSPAIMSLRPLRPPAGGEAVSNNAAGQV